MTSETADTLKAAEKIVDGLVTLPTIPTIMQELNKSIGDVNCSMATIAKIVTNDQAIATKVLRISNSSFYGARTRVVSIQHAVSILGTRVLKNLVLQATTIASFGHLTGNKDFDLDAFWKHSIKVAMACQILAQHSPNLPGKPDEFYSMGLIHDIGKVILLDSKTDEFLQAVRRSRELGGDSAAAEREIFGFDHAQIGGVLATKWKLPEELAQGIFLHHQEPDGKDYGKVLGVLVHLADQLVHKLEELEAKEAATEEGGEPMEAAIGLHPVGLDLLAIKPEKTPDIAEELKIQADTIEI